MLLHSHDADDAAPAPDGRHRTSVHVRGGVGATRVDLTELREIEARLEGLRGDTSQLANALLAAQRQFALDATWAPQATGRADGAVDDALHGWWGVNRLAAEAFELLMALRYARIMYEEAELAARALPPAPSWVHYVLFLLSPLTVTADGALDVAGELLHVGRVPGYRPSTAGGHVVAALAELVNIVIGDDDLPPDGVALDRAVRELGESGQLGVPWFLAPRPFTYDGRSIDVDQLTGAQRFIIPVVMQFHALTRRRPGSATDLQLRVAPSRPVPAPPDLAAAVRDLTAIHHDHGATPGTVEIRRTDHPDGRRSWVVMLPSTQAMVPGSANPVDNLTNVEAYGGLVTDVEIGAARAMEAAGIAPGEEVAVVGFSQGGLVGMRLAADPLVRARYRITTVVTAGSPVGHLPTPEGTEVLHLEHLEDPIIGLDGTSNPADPDRTTVVRSLATGTTGELAYAVPPGQSHSIEQYARTAELALAAEEQSVVHVSERLAAIAGGPGATVTATAFTLRRGE